MNPPAGHPPLLLRRSGVLDWLPAFTKDLVHDYRHEGDLRVFRPNPATRAAYYFAVDVAKIAGRSLDTGWLAGLPRELRDVEFCRHSGLAPWALYLALKHGVLGQRRAADGVRVPSSELRRFL